MNARICVISLLLVTAASLLPGEEGIHVVQKGETVFSIARSYGVDQAALMSANGISDPTKLRAGQRLTIPGAAGGPPGATPASAAPAAGPSFHETAYGETFYGIARKYGVTVNDLRAVNNLGEDYVLRQGDVLRLPGRGAATPAATAKPAAPQPPPPAASPAVVSTTPPPASVAAEEKPVPLPSAESARAVDKRAVDASIRWPVAAQDLSYMTGKLSGVVITGDRAEAVRSLTAGTVISAGPYRGFGRVVIVQTGEGYLYVYGGCERLSVKEGDPVESGTELGQLGIDAVSGRPQLFFLVYRSNAPVDPAKAPRA